MEALWGFPSLEGQERPELAHQLFAKMFAASKKALTFPSLEPLSVDAATRKGSCKDNECTY
jgi:hypothetical protein